MDWQKIYHLVHVARTAQDFPQIHWLRDAALGELAKHKEDSAEPIPEPDQPGQLGSDPEPHPIKIRSLETDNG